MRNLDEHTITDAVLARHAGTRDARLRQVLDGLVRHLHAFAREVALTESEWEAGIGFLTAVGQTCSPTRQEFILLSDTLGLSMLVTAQQHAKPEGCTEATVFGPFHVPDSPRLALGADLAQDAPGVPCFVQGRVLDPAGAPVAGATLEVWHCDGRGLYDVQYEPLAAHRARATLQAQADGAFHFRSVLPVPYPIPHDGPVGRMLQALGRHPWRPAHLHFRITAPGFETLVTHVFRDGDPYLDSDAVFGVRSSLIVPWQQHLPGVAPDGSWVDTPFHSVQFDFVLQPA